MREKTPINPILLDPVIEIRISVVVRGTFFKESLPRVSDWVSLKFVEKKFFRQERYENGGFASKLVIPKPILLSPFPDDLRRTQKEEEFVDKSVQIELLPPGRQKTLLDLLR